MSGARATVSGNSAKAGKAEGYVLSGSGGIGGGFLVTGTNNSFKTNIAENNKGSEWVIGAGNVDLGSNRKNGKTFTFTPAGGTFE